MGEDARALLAELLRVAELMHRAEQSEYGALLRCATDASKCPQCCAIAAVRPLLAAPPAEPREVFGWIESHAGIVGPHECDAYCKTAPPAETPGEEPSGLLLAIERDIIEPLEWVESKDDFLAVRKAAGPLGKRVHELLRG